MLLQVEGEVAIYVHVRDKGVGLHLSIFDTWKLGLRKMGCNHCTGRLWAEKAAAHGLPLLPGSDAYLGYPKLPKAAAGGRAFLGNGDHATF